MNFKTKKSFYLLLCFIMLLGLCSCNTPFTSKNTDGCLELVNSPSTTLDNVWYNPGGIFRCAIFESLLTTDASMKNIDYALAKGYSVSEDGCTYTFTLRQDVKWHDGEIFDSEDVLFSFKAALRSEEINGILSSAFKYIEGADEYIAGTSDKLSGVTVDRNIITIKLTTPIANFLDAIAQFAILPEHILGDVAPADLPSHEYWKNPIGCGCYKVAEAVEGEYFLLKANKDYYGEQPGISQLRIRLNETDYVTAMEEGRLDFYITNDPEEISQLKGIDNCSEHDLNILFPAYLIINLSDDEGTNEYLADPNVRKALLIAIDRNTIVNAIFPGSTVTDTLVPSWDEWYLTNADTYEFNPDKARQLLEDAGFDFSKTIRLRYSAKGQATVDLMNSIAVYWRAIGIQVDLQKFDGSGSEHMFNIRDFDVCYKRLSAFNYGSIYEEIHGDGIMQTSLYNQPVYDEDLALLEITRDLEKRKEIVQNMQVLDQECLLRLPLFSLANFAYVNDSRLDMPEAYGNMWYRYDLQFDDWRLVN